MILAIFYVLKNASQVTFIADLVSYITEIQLIIQVKITHVDHIIQGITV